jgi:transcriptional regulator with XRE-family HTH domain
LDRAGSWLRSERERRGWTGAEFARRLDIQQVRISAYERGQYEVPVETARKIAEVFEVTEWEVWRGLQLPLPRELDDDEAIQRALALRPDVMAQVPEIVEKVTGEKPKGAPPVPRDAPKRRPGDTRSGDRRRNPDMGAESAV